MIFNFKKNKVYQGRENDSYLLGCKILYSRKI